MNTKASGSQTRTRLAPVQDTVTWNVDDVPWTPLTGLYINESGYKDVVPPEFSDGAYSIELTKVGPGGFSPTHVESWSHVFYVLAGQGEVTAGKEIKKVRPGSVSPIPAGMPHSFRNLGDGPLEMLVIYHAPRDRTVLKAQVYAIRHEVERTVVVDLRPVHGEVFPSFDPGSHIDVHLGNGMTRSYSLCNPARQKGRYVLGVENARDSRGGSRYIHEQLHVGAEMDISRPRNNFQLTNEAGHTVLISGGIGITPILCMLDYLHQLGRSVELLYCAHSRSDAPFVKQIEQIGEPVTWHFSDEHGGRIDLRRFIAGRPSKSHFYACGPELMLDDIVKISAELGREPVHLEHFV